MPSCPLGAVGGRGWAGGSRGGRAVLLLPLGVSRSPSLSALLAENAAARHSHPGSQELPRPITRTTKRGAAVFEDPLGVIPSCLTAPRAKVVFCLFFFASVCFSFSLRRDAGDNTQAQGRGR